MQFGGTNFGARYFEICPSACFTINIRRRPRALYYLDFELHLSEHAIDVEYSVS